MSIHAAISRATFAAAVVLCVACAADTPIVGGGETLDSTLSFSYSTAAPAAPTSLTATAASINQVNLQWHDDGAAKSGFLIESRTSGTTVYSTVGTVSSATTSFQHTGLAPATTYAYHVRACADLRCSDRPAEASATTLVSTSTPAVAAAPTVTTRAATVVTTTSATIGGTVTANKLASTAWTEYATNSALTGAVVAASRAGGDGTTSVSIEDHLTGLTAGTTYYYRAVGSNSLGRTNGPTLTFTTNLK